MAKKQEPTMGMPHVGRFRINLIAAIIGVPLTVQLVYSIPIMEPRVSADAVLGFCGVVVGLVFAAKRLYEEKYAEQMLTVEYELYARCLDLLKKLSLNPDYALSQDISIELIELSCQLKTLRTRRSDQIHNALKELAQDILDRNAEFRTERYERYNDVFGYHGVISPDGESGEDSNYLDPEAEWENTERQLMEKYRFDHFEFRNRIDRILRDLGKKFWPHDGS